MPWRGLQARGEAAPGLLAGLAGRAQNSAAGTGSAELRGDPAAEGTVNEYMVHAFKSREERLIYRFHWGLPPISRVLRSGEEEGEGNPCAVIGCWGSSMGRWQRDRARGAAFRAGF